MATFLGSARDFDLHTAAASVEPEDLVTLIYTSGTTGPPKGVQLTHANMLALLRSLDAAWPMLASAMGGQVVSFLPHAHIADRLMSHYGALMAYGARVTTVPALGDLIPTVMQVHPTFLGSVPRVWEKFMSALQAGVFGPLDDAARVRRAVGLDKCELFSMGAARRRWNCSSSTRASASRSSRCGG
jgi:long-subunit acyl-CoA synthetase (AMP-forming)